jgi:hypothetical protein
MTCILEDVTSQECHNIPTLLYIRSKKSSLWKWWLSRDLNDKKEQGRECHREEHSRQKEQGTEAQRLER